MQWRQTICHIAQQPLRRVAREGGEGKGGGALFICMLPAVVGVEGKRRYIKIIDGTRNECLYKSWL